MKIQKTTETLKFHRLSDMFPAMVEWSPRAHNLLHTDENEAWQEFVRDVRINGQREPIVLLDGEIIDGRHRYLACRSLGIPVLYVEADGDPLALVLSLNLHRRHLTMTDRSVIYRKVREYMEADQPVGGDRPSHSVQKDGIEKPSKTAREKAAEIAGIGSGTAARIDALTDEEFEEVKTGAKRPSAVYREKKEREAKAAAKKAKAGHVPSQQKVVNPLLEAAYRYMDKANEALEEALLACDEYGWTGLDEHHREDLATVSVDLSKSINALPWGEKGSD